MSNVSTRSDVSPRASKTEVSPNAADSDRAIVFLTSGRRSGSVTRLVSPSHVGQLIKPFVFLDHAVLEPRPGTIGIHPHSGIATLTVMLSGAMTYEDTTGKTGRVPAGGLEWMKAGNGVWHDGGAALGETLRAFQLWVALSPDEENSPAESQYIDPDQVQQDGPVRVVLGRYGTATSPINAPDGINYLHVRLKDGETWRYHPPVDHTVAWLAIDEGRLRAVRTIEAGQLAVFAEGHDSIELRAEGDTSFVLGSAIKHPHALVLGKYSVHTSDEALRRGEAEIHRIGLQLPTQAPEPLDAS